MLIYVDDNNVKFKFEFKIELRQLLLVQSLELTEARVAKTVLQ